MSRFKIQIPTKRYLARYIETLYGNPVEFSSDRYFGTIVHGLLARPIRDQNPPDVIQQRFDKLDGFFIMKAPKWWLEKKDKGYDITDDHAFSLTKLFENRFEEELYMFCQLMMMTGVETKDALIAFCVYYNIVIDEDITYDCLKKKEYRYRIGVEKSLENFGLKCPLQKPPILSEVSLKKLKTDLSFLEKKS